jgi:hypothetical protein
MDWLSRYILLASCTKRLAWRDGFAVACREKHVRYFDLIAANKSRITTSDRESSGARFYRPELDVLRFVAFLMVFATHALPKYLDQADGPLLHTLSALLTV